MTSETPNEPHGAVQLTQEGQRLAVADTGTGWRQWGPYLSERQWGTVREDYSADGDAWEYFPHDHARSRAYRWGEDGIGGFADDKLNLCLSVALWNGQDPFLKERLFGLTNGEGNHGEDVKEQYYYLDGTPTHSYMRMLYKYPQAAFPYARLLEENARRGLQDREFELLDTGIFDGGDYFDVFIEYAKGAPDEILLQITVHNRSAQPASLHLIPQLWSHNTWSWKPGQQRPSLHAVGASDVDVRHPSLPPMRWSCEGNPALLFCENDTNVRRLDGVSSEGFFKDGINDCIVNGDSAAVNPAQRGTKVGAHYQLELAGNGEATVRLRLCAQGASASLADFDTAMGLRRKEADEFYEALQHGMTDEDCRRVHRQALAGMLWSKQFYCFDVREWLNGDPLQPPPPDSRKSGRDADWGHLVCGDILSMPDKWEYPWFASWDLAFHCVTFALIDPAFAKAQLVTLTQTRYMHPNGQLPAYEWAFGDANPPVHAWAALQIYQIDRERSGVGDTVFLERVFHKLMLNFTWWVNRKDANGRNIFQGGFLGLDNIGLFDRSSVLQDEACIDQSDGTAWVGMYALSMMRMALELAIEWHVYEDLATKFFEHFLYIAEAVHGKGGATSTGLWDDEDGFYYDVLQTPGKSGTALRVRSMVGLIPLLAVEVLHDEFIVALPQFTSRLGWFLTERNDLACLVSHFTDQNKQEYRLLSLMRRDRLNRVLRRMLDETEFLSDFGLRAVSKYHEAHPAVFKPDGADELVVRYTPGESDTRLFGGNSNWRGPVWMPLNYLIIESLYKYHKFYGDDFSVEYPTGSGKKLHLDEIAEELANRLKRIFVRGADGRRVFFGDSPLQDDPHFRDYILFYEYFHGDTGRGVGASHQTGWTGLIALMLHPRHENDPAHVAPATVTTTQQTAAPGASP